MAAWHCYTNSLMHIRTSQLIYDFNGRRIECLWMYSNKAYDVALNETWDVGNPPQTSHTCR